MVGLGNRIHYGIWKKVRVTGHGASEARDESERQSGADAGIILNPQHMRKRGSSTESSRLSSAGYCGKEVVDGKNNG